MIDDAQLEPFLQHLWLDRGLSEHTRAAYRTDLRTLLTWREAQGLSPLIIECTADELQQFLAWRVEKQYHPRSTARCLSSIRAFFRFQVEEGVVAQDITTLIARPKVGRALPNDLSQLDVLALLEAPDTQTALGLRDRTMLEILYGSGLRISELINITLDQINLRQGVIRVTGKGEKDRLTPVGEHAQEWIVRYVKEGRGELLGLSPSRFLFPGRQGNPLTRQTVWHRIKQYAVEAGINSNVSPHTLRHAFATHLINHGADLRVIQMLLGHSDLSTTQIYTHIAQHRLEQIHQQHHPRG